MKHSSISISSLIIVIMILIAMDVWTLNANAQTDSPKNDSNSGTKEMTTKNITSIITPWNTGNDRINNSVE
ncbi:MAG: hypothetical protein AB7V56_10795 [Candidatus Nitrosocosmicus sp.]